MNIFRLSVRFPAGRGAAAVGSPAPSTITPSVAAGGYHTLLLGSDGKVYSCGDNSAGQLGQATAHSVVGTPTRMKWLNPEIAITGIAAGIRHTLLLATTGEVYSCGDNSFGQLGQAIMQQIVETPTRMKWLLCPQIAIIDIAAGSFHTLLLGSDSKVYSCGYNSCGQLGYNTDGVQEVMPRPIKTLPPIKGIAAGSDHTILLATNGEVYSCGDNSFGQLGHGTQASQHRPMRIGRLPRIKGIAAGNDHTILLATNGEVYSCGYNGFGQLGHGAEQPRPMRIEGLPPIKGIAAGGKHTLLLTENGEVYSCGANNRGQLGHGTQASQHQPMRIKALPRITGIAAGGNHTLLLAENGKVYSCGYNCYGQLGQKPMIQHTPEEKEIVTPTPMQTLDSPEVASVAREEEYCNIM